MTLLSRKADYAMLILLHLHQNPEGGCAREIAERFHLSRAFVANILKELSHKGFVKSHRGVKGGYLLRRSLDEINFSELIESLDQPFRLAECNHAIPDDGCELVHQCPMKGPMAVIHDRILKLLSTVTLAEIFQQVSANDGLVTVSLPSPSGMAELEPALAQTILE